MIGLSLRSLRCPAAALRLAFFPPLAQHLAGFIMAVFSLGTPARAAGRCAGLDAALPWPQVRGAARLCAAPGTALGRTSQASPCSEGAWLPSPSS